MLSFDAPTKEMFVQRAIGHQLADEIVQGTYWSNGKGCAVGCFIHGSSHEKLSRQLGIPLQMAYLIDTLFENMPVKESKTFPARFVQAIPVGRDLQFVIDRWYLELLNDPTRGAIAFASDKVRPAIQNVIHLYRRKLSGDYPKSKEWDAAREAAADAARAAAGAERDAAWAAEAAARGAEWSAEAAAEAAADAEWAAEAAAGTDHFIWQANLLIALLESAA